MTPIYAKVVIVPSVVDVYCGQRGPARLSDTGFG